MTLCFLQVAAMMSESSAMLQSTTAPLQSNGLQDDECDTCELVVMQVASMLRNPVSHTCRMVQ